MAKQRQLTVDIAALRAARTAAGFSQRGLSEAIGAAVSLVGLIETGRRQPSFETAAKIADALGVKIADFAEIHLSDDALRQMAEAIRKALH